MHGGKLQVVFDRTEIMASEEALYPQGRRDPDRAGAMTEAGGRDSTRVAGTAGSLPRMWGPTRGRVSSGTARVHAAR